MLFGEIWEKYEELSKEQQELIDPVYPFRFIQKEKKQPQMIHGNCGTEMIHDGEDWKCPKCEIQEKHSK